LNKNIYDTVDFGALGVHIEGQNNGLFNPSIYKSRKYRPFIDIVYL